MNIRYPIYEGVYRILTLIDSMLCDDSQISEMDNTKNETGAFDINEFV